MVKLEHIHVKGNKYELTLKTMNAIVDTGTSLIIADISIVEEIHSLLGVN